MPGNEATNTSTEPSGDYAQNIRSPDEDDSKATTLPLPPRPAGIDRRDHQPLQAPSESQRGSLRPSLRTHTTTAVSLTDIFTHFHSAGTRETYSTATHKPENGVTSDKPIPGPENEVQKKKKPTSKSADSASISSNIPASEGIGEVESLLGDVWRHSNESSAWGLVTDQAHARAPFSVNIQEDEELGEDFLEEFKELEPLDHDGANQEYPLQRWRSRMKHFLILSSAGKPIYSRHGDDELISEYIGIIQTIISSFQTAVDSLKSFTAARVRFVIMAEGPLYLVAISRLGESDSQLMAQLEALYMQVLSTLTLPTLTTLFSNRPSTDLRRPLQGTEPLLSALADTFTRGSPSTLLSALECLKIRKSHRQVINNTLLKTKASSLLYGLMVAGGRLVSVIRPRKHSLHPSDLQLIFNMLFEAGGVKAGEGENWIPLCLPAFNNRGYLYMYVSFLGEYADNVQENGGEKEDQVALILISAEKEGFYALKQMREEVMQQLEANGSMTIIRTAVRKGRPTMAEIAPGTVIRHFVYKSRSNVQFVQPSFSPDFDSLITRRKLLSLYHRLHASTHAKNAHLKVHHCISREAVSLAWVTPLFELYCVASPNVGKTALAQGANKVVQWVKREEERVFIIGGAIF